jgi:hypothetical protein
VIPAANLPVGTTANKIVQLDASAKIPALDGSQITALVATNIATGTLPVTRGGTGATAAANAANGVVVLNASSQLPAVSGALLTDLPVTDTNTSNVVYSFGTTEAANAPTETGSSYVTHQHFKFKKIAGISTVTFYAYLNSSGSGGLEYVKIDIGGCNNEATRTRSTTEGWSSAAAIDVSSLTNGTFYDGIVQMKTVTASEYLYAVTAIGS